MNKFDTLERVMDTVETLKAEVAAAKDAGKSIGRLQRKAKLLNIIGELIEAYAPEEFELKTAGDLEQALNPKKGKKVVLEVNKGDKLMDLLNKYADVKDVYARIQKTCAEKGLKIVLDHIE